MQIPIYIGAGFFSTIFIIIVIFSIISGIKNAIAPKKKDTQPTKADSDTVESLEDFLKKISQGQQTSTQPKPPEQHFQEIAPPVHSPPPPPPVIRHVEKIKTVEHTVSQEDINHRVRKIYEDRKRELEGTYQTAQEQQSASDAYTINDQVTHTTEAVRIRQLLINDLRDKEYLMKAMVLKEVLDVPLGLRRNESR